MSTAPNRMIVAVFAFITGAVSVVTLLAMVIAPYCTGIMHKAGLYKIGSLCVFIPAFYVFAWRKNSLIFAILIPTLQIICGWMFAGYLNSLPMGCPQ